MPDSDDTPPPPGPQQSGPGATPPETAADDSPAAPEREAVVAALAALVPPVLVGLDALGYAARHLHPPDLEKLSKELEGLDAPIREARPRFEAISWPAPLEPARDRILAAADAVTRGLAELAAAATAPNPILAAYRALRHSTRASEALYPVSAILPPVSRFFLEPGLRDDEAKLNALSEGAARPDVGVMEARNAADQRGGFSLYVPEDYDPATPAPLVMALHGGSGHGRDFLWLWLREARSRGIILISPTARGDTWALTGDDVDTPNLEAMLAFVRERCNVDPARMLLTGMSDGGTFTYVTGLRAQSPFTHLAPISSAFHPLLAEMADAARLAGLPVHITHGRLDWMFPAELAQAAAEALEARGARASLDIIPDLSHTYPREANARILDWFLG